MPKLGRPNSKEKRLYFFEGQSEVLRKAPFGTNYTPNYITKIVGSRYKKIEDNSHLSPRKPLTPIQRLEDGIKSVNSKPILPPIFSERERTHLLSELVALLPPGNDIPSKGLYMTNSEQVSLLNITKHEILDIPDLINNLKRIYLMLTRIDVNLTGICSFKEFVDACHNNNVHLSWDLFRVIASQFLVPTRDDVGFVNYEKIISFLGATHNNLAASGRSSPKEPWKDSTDHPIYYHDNRCSDVIHDDRKHDNYIHVDDLELTRNVCEDLGFYPIPIQTIRMLCQRTDSFHRGTLSAKQLEDICNSEGLHLKRHTFEKLLHRCKYMGGGQYNWQQFVEFMEKLQPISTGLQIPSSKMPLDYMKHVPAPASSWPHAESPDIHHDISDYNIDKVPSPRPAVSRQDFSQQHSPRSEYRSSPTNNDRPSLYDNAVVNTQRSSPEAEGEPYFNRFLKFVDAIYLKDVKSKGILPTRDLFEYATTLNNQLGLNITTTEIISALDGSSAGHDNQYSNINSFLKRLSIRSYKLY